MSLTRRSFIKKSSYSAAAVTAFGTGVGLADGISSNAGMVKKPLTKEYTVVIESDVFTGVPLAEIEADPNFGAAYQAALEKWPKNTDAAENTPNVDVSAPVTKYQWVEKKKTKETVSHSCSPYLDDEASLVESEIVENGAKYKIVFTFISVATYTFTEPSSQ